MSLPVLLFTVIALSTALSALAVVFARNIVRAAVWLLFTLIGVSMLYFLLGAEFVGSAQLIIYVGGTLVLVVFGVMLTAQGPFLRLQTRAGEWAAAGTLAAVLFGMLVYTSLQLGRAAPEPHPPEANPARPPVGVGALGLAFLNVREEAPATVTGLPQGAKPVPRTPLAYLLPFEIVSVHLLVVLIGAAYLARAKRRPPAKEPAA